MRILPQYGHGFAEASPGRPFLGRLERLTQQGGRNELEQLVKQYNLISDGHLPWLLLPPNGGFESFFQDMQSQGVGVAICVIATSRSIGAVLMSELHHWVLHNLEANAGLDERERRDLEDLLRRRVMVHLEMLKRNAIVALALEEMETWPIKLERLLGASLTEPQRMHWGEALREAGQQNNTLPLPLEGVLLTLRIGPGRMRQRRRSTEYCVI